MTSSELIKIIQSASKNNVESIEIGDLCYIKFKSNSDKSDYPERVWPTPSIPNVYTLHDGTPLVKDDDVPYNENDDVYPTVSNVADGYIVEDELENLAIEDPLKYEEMIHQEGN